MRGDQADPQFFLTKAAEIAKQYDLKMISYKGK